jgi:hypothetical protein
VYTKAFGARPLRAIQKLEDRGAIRVDQLGGRGGSCRSHSEVSTRRVGISAMRSVTSSGVASGVASALHAGGRLLMSAAHLASVWRKLITAMVFESGKTPSVWRLQKKSVW